jgi:hypothetical protein
VGLREHVFEVGQRFIRLGEGGPLLVRTLHDVGPKDMVEQYCQYLIDCVWCVAGVGLVNSNWILENRYMIGVDGSNCSFIVLSLASSWSGVMLPYASNKNWIIARALTREYPLMWFSKGLRKIGYVMAVITC